LIETTKRHAFVADEVRNVIESDTFPVRVAVAGLLPPVAAIARPLAEAQEAVRMAATLGRAGYLALAALSDAEERDSHAPLQKAVQEAAAIRFSADAVVAAAEALEAARYREGAMKGSMASALKEVFGPLRICFEKVKRKVNAARGFDALDAACAGAGRKSALELFALRWGSFRRTSRPPEVDPLAAACVAQDLTRLKELIGGHDVEKLEVDVEKLPFDLPRPRRKAATLLVIAGAVGGGGGWGQVPRYLLEFHQLKPVLSTLVQAVAFGDPETIRMIWDRMAAGARVGQEGPLVAAIEFHHGEVAKWLTAEHPPWCGLARRLAREKRAVDVLSRLPEGDETLPELDPLALKHVKALEQLGVPLASSELVFTGFYLPSVFDAQLCRVGRSLLLVEGDEGRTLGALIAIPWPQLRCTAKDVWCRSFLFTIDGEEVTRYPAVTPPALSHDLEKICVGELVVKVTKQRRYWIDASSTCTGGRFPAMSSGAARSQRIWEL
jgi:hypothetical protein